MRWRLDLGYDGTDFSGWAVQPELRTVQGELAQWLPRVLRLGSTPLTLVCAGRTDAGVHARGQVAHVDLPDGTDVDGPRLLRRLGRVLDGDLVVFAARPAPEGFDARFSALWRRYTYRIKDGELPPDPLARRTVAHLRPPLDAPAITAAGQQLLGLRDFGAFCKRREGATTVRTLLELRADRTADGLLEVTVRADAFCHSMVRSLVGALVAVGSGRRDVAWLAAVTARAARDPGIGVLPACGLTLEEVAYPPDAELAVRADAARTVRSLP